MQQIFQRDKQIEYLQKIHWADNFRVIDFTAEIAPKDRLKVFVREHNTDKVYEGDYGLYDDALILRIGDGDFKLDKLEISDSGFLTGRMRFSSRQALANIVEFDGIQKQTK